LKKRKQEAKRVLFLRLAIILAVAYSASFIFLCIQVGAEFANVEDTWWRGWWIWDMWWAWLHFVLLICVGILWRPNANNSRYALAVELPGDDPSTPRKNTARNTGKVELQDMDASTEKTRNTGLESAKENPKEKDQELPTYPKKKIESDDDEQRLERKAKDSENRQEEKEVDKKGSELEESDEEINL